MDEMSSLIVYQSSGLLSRDRTQDCGPPEEDLYSIISSATDMLTSLDISESVTDLTSSDSSVKTLAMTDTETYREPRQSDVNIECDKQSDWTQSERKENIPHEESQISAMLKTKIVTEV